MNSTSDDADLRDAVNELDSGWTPRPRPFPPALVRRVAVAAAAFVVAAGAALVGLDAGRPLTWWTLPLAMVYLLATQVRFEVGPAWVLMTQLPLVPLLFVAPLNMVPLVVGACMLAGALIGVAIEDLPRDRLLSALAASWHVIPPVLVLALAGAPDPRPEHWWVFMAAFAAQAAAELLLEVFLHAGAEEGPWAREDTLQLAAGQLVDLLLFPIGLVAAAAAYGTGAPGWALLTLPTRGASGAYRRRPAATHAPGAGPVGRARARARAK